MVHSLSRVVSVKTNAAAATTAAILSEWTLFTWIINAGVAGVTYQQSSLSLGDIVVANKCVYCRRGLNDARLDFMAWNKWDSLLEISVGNVKFLLIRGCLSDYPRPWHRCIQLRQSQRVAVRDAASRYRYFVTSTGCYLRSNGGRGCRARSNYRLNSAPAIEIREQFQIQRVDSDSQEWDI